jgi:hypothetical protein
MSLDVVMIQLSNGQTVWDGRCPHPITITQMNNQLIDFLGTLKKEKNKGRYQGT